MSKKILILENDPEIKGVLRTHLLDQGYDVLCPVDAYVAIEFTENEHCDLLILNDAMPVINGKNTLELLKAAQKLMPAIVLTEKKGQEVNYSEFPSCATLAKPFRIETLLEHVKSLIKT